MNVCLLLFLSNHMDVGEYFPPFCSQRLLASRARTSRTTSSCWASLSWASTKLSLLLRLASKMWKTSKKTKTQTRWMHFFFYGCKETTTAKEYNTMSHVGLLNSACFSKWPAGWSVGPQHQFTARARKDADTWHQRFSFCFFFCFVFPPFRL